MAIPVRNLPGPMVPVIILIPGEVLKPDAEAQAVTEPAEDTVI